MSGKYFPIAEKSASGFNVESDTPIAGIPLRAASCAAPSVPEGEQYGEDVGEDSGAGILDETNDEILGDNAVIECGNYRHAIP